MDVYHLLDIKYNATILPDMSREYGTIVRFFDDKLYTIFSLKYGQWL